MKSEIRYREAFDLIEQALIAVRHALQPFTVYRAEKRAVERARDDLWTFVNYWPIGEIDDEPDSIYTGIVDALAHLNSALGKHFIDVVELERAQVALSQVGAELAPY